MTALFLSEDLSPFPAILKILIRMFMLLHGLDEVHRRSKHIIGSSILN